MVLENPWLAIDASTSPTERAGELRSEWERFLAGGDAADVRGPIARSWERSTAAGVDPSPGRHAPLAVGADEVADRWGGHPLAATAPVIEACLGPITADAEHLIVVSDADGTLLWIDGDGRVRGRAADTMNFAEGALWSEAGAGTNAVGTALAADHAVQVFAAEHFNETVQAWTCSAAPIHDPDSGELLGVVDLTSAMRAVHPHSFGCAVATAHAVESHLRSLMAEHDQGLRSKYGDRVAAAGRGCSLLTPSGRVIAGDGGGWAPPSRLAVPPGGGEITLPSGRIGFAEAVGHGEAFIVRASERSAGRRSGLRLTLLGEDRARVETGGHSVRLSRRQTEIVALLAARPAGLTTDELAAAVYGDAGRPGAVRVQIHRLRKLLGPWLETEPHRLAVDVESDVARVRGLLDQGASREAAERCAGPLAPRSDAPGVVREREALEAWLRHAVMTSDDPDAVWAWVQSPSGSADLPAWKRLVAGLDYTDPRHALAAARLAQLRTAFE